MDREPSPGNPGASESQSPGWPLRGVTPDWADDAEWARMCAGRGDEAELPDLDEEFYADPDHGAPGQWEELPPEAVTARAKAAAQEAAVRARLIAAGLEGDAHRRGAPPRPGIPAGPAAGFGQGCPLDALAPSTIASGLADEASGENRAFTGGWSTPEPAAGSAGPPPPAAATSAAPPSIPTDQHGQGTPGRWDGGEPGDESTGYRPLLRARALA